MENFKLGIEYNVDYGTFDIKYLSVLMCEEEFSMYVLNLIYPVKFESYSESSCIVCRYKTEINRIYLICDDNLELTNVEHGMKLLEHLSVNKKIYRGVYLEKVKIPLLLGMKNISLNQNDLDNLDYRNDMLKKSLFVGCQHDGMEDILTDKFTGHWVLLKLRLGKTRDKGFVLFKYGYCDHSRIPHHKVLECDIAGYDSLFVYDLVIGVSDKMLPYVNKHILDYILSLDRI